jgi:hypothetical protein
MMIAAGPPAHDEALDSIPWSGYDNGPAGQLLPGKAVHGGSVRIFHICRGQDGPLQFFSCKNGVGRM